MTSGRWIVAFVVMTAALLPPAVLAQTASGTDKALASRIEGRLKASPTLKHDHLTVAVDKGVVTLTGRVGSAAQSTRAAALAKVRGVSRVDNHLRIDPALAHGTKDGDGRPDGAAADAAKGAAVATKEAAGSVAGAVTDAWIVTKLHAEFVNEPLLKGSDIHVESDRHVVTLSGTVESAEGRTRAARIARTTNGVTQVVNTLTVGSKR